MVDTNSSITWVEDFSENGDGRTLSSLLILPDDLPTWLQAVTAILQPTHLADTLEQAIALIKTHHPQVILSADANDHTLAFLKALAYTGGYQPARVLITENFERVELYDCVDAVLPPLPRYIYHQVHRLPQMITEHERLRTQTLELVEEKQALNARLETAEKAREELNLLKSAIVRTVSHELGTPLLQVKSAVHLLAEDAQNQKLADYALGATARLEAVVKNITQLANSVDEMNVSVLLIRECVDYAVRNLRRTWEHRDDTPRIKVQQDPYLAPALGDKQGISTALQLLIDNALKFSDKDVEVHVQQRQDKIWITVRDYGIGIPADKQEAIFQTFYQVDNSSTRRVGGMGIGLAIVQLILERHGATIKLESEEGQGSTFSFSLPVAQIENM